MVGIHARIGIILVERRLESQAETELRFESLRVDALLGAAALGDIGKHFPDTDPAYKGINSLKLLAHVGTLLKEHGYSVGNIDSTVVAQRPKMAPHIHQMRQNIADTLGISVDQVSVKATTTERLGFEGREEGISAQAVALLV